MTEPAGVSDFLADTRHGYDLIAGPYADRFHHHLDRKPVDRAMLAAFAGLVGAGDNVVVADVGCGTGASTGILRDHGLRPLGIDLSSEMLDQARRRNPDLGFSVGSMTGLALPDEAVGGVCAWYSIIHVPDDHLPTVFDEFARVLIPGGYLLLAFQVGEQPRRVDEAFGRPVALTFHRRSPELVETLLAGSGFGGYARLIREPDEGTESTPQAYLIARKHATTTSHRSAIPG